MLYKIQTEPVTDHITDDGTELTKQPYPIICDERGIIQGSPTMAYVVGFVRDLARQAIDIAWEDAIQPPLDEGMPLANAVLRSYLIVAGHDGGWATLSTAIVAFEKLSPPSPDEDADNQPMTKAELKAALADFAAEVGMDLEAERLDWGPGTTAAFERLAERLNIRR